MDLKQELIKFKNKWIGLKQEQVNTNNEPK